MDSAFVTITGTDHYLGKKPFRINRLVKLADEVEKDGEQVIEADGAERTPIGPKMKIGLKNRVKKERIKNERCNNRRHRGFGI